MIQNCLSKRLRRYVREDTLKLKDLLAKARSLEASETQTTGIEKNLPSEEINQLSHKRQQSKLPMKSHQDNQHNPILIHVDNVGRSGRTALNHVQPRDNHVTNVESLIISLKCAVQK